MNHDEWIRCCARCERVFHKWNEGKFNGVRVGGCPSCGFAHYGARFVYGRWSYLYVFFRLIIDYFRINFKR